MDEFARNYLAAKLRECDQVIEDLESMAETPPEYEALERLTEWRLMLQRALESLNPRRLTL